MQDLLKADWPDLNRYTPPHGTSRLVGALVERVRSRTGESVLPENILVTGGATAGLANTVGAVLSPGEEILVLAPHWPLIDGIIRCFGGIPVPVPFLGIASDPETAIEAVRSHLTERTIGIYMSTPNNPTGRVIPKPVVEALADWARKENLWILSDEVYEDYVYEGQHVYTRPLAPERTFSCHSFSKALGMAGYRCGYIAGPSGIMGQLRKTHTHTVYSASTPAQAAALVALEGSAAPWIEKARDLYRLAGEAAAAVLGVEKPQGSTFLFLDVASRLDERGLVGFLEDCANEGLFAAPGPSFGPYPTHLRICYTATPPENVQRGVAILARLMGRTPEEKA
jgi:N-succinyldiaminopimelate aminotransferase